MGLRGPAPTPTRLLRLRGSRTAESRAGEPHPEPERPAAPDWLRPEARAAFDALAERLDALQVLAGIDQNALARYAVLWVRYRKCEEFLAEHGDVYVVRAKPNWKGEPGPPVGFKLYPHAKEALALASELLRLEREFGLTPAARARLATEVTVEDDETSDYFGAPR